MPTIVCNRKRPRRHRVQVNITLDPHILEKGKEYMTKIGETSLSSFVEGLIDCIVRETCEGCPAYEDLPEKEKDRIEDKVGVAKRIISESEEGEGG